MDLIERCIQSKNYEFLNSSIPYQILSEQIQAVMREAKVLKEDSQDESCKLRRHLSKQIYDLVFENSKFRKTLNRMNKLLKHHY